jgi:hypothetical protein
MEECTDVRTAVMGGQARIGKCSNMAFISFNHLLHLWIYCIYLIVIQLFYIYAFHNDCVSSDITEQMLPTYADRPCQVISSVKVWDMQLTDIYLFDIATFGGFHISKMTNLYGTS